jgi:hypothetical protein
VAVALDRSPGFTRDYLELSGTDMARRLVSVLHRLATACPICAVPEDMQMTTGIRAGAFVLIAATAVVLVPLAAFAVRLWRAERDGR